MLSLKERFKLLELDLESTPPAFTMSSDLPFAIFRYDPTDQNENEWIVRDAIQKLASRIQNKTGRKVHQLKLSDLYWQSIEESEGIAAIINLERQRGFDQADAQVHTYLSDPDFRPLPRLLQEATANLVPKNDYLFLTQASVFAPSTYRLSSLLEQMMGKTSVPTVLFYPGTWSGSLNYMNLKGEDVPLGTYRVKIYGRDT